MIKLAKVSNVLAKETFFFRTNGRGFYWFGINVNGTRYGVELRLR